MTTSSRLDLPEVALARHRHWVVTHPRLRSAGLSDAAIRHRVRTGRLHEIHRGVYAVGRPDLTREGRWLGAVLACGPGAVLSHLPAGLLWGVVEDGPERPHVTVPTQNGRRPRRTIALHRSATLTGAECTVRDHIPVTGLQRTLVDVAGEVGRPALKAAIRRAQRLHGLDLLALRAAVDAPISAPRTARLRRVLDVYVPVTRYADSELEARFLELCRRHRLPQPETQVRFGPHRADFVWRDRGLIVETDGRAWHDGDIAFVEDRARDRALKAYTGYEILRYTWGEVVHEPAAVARELRDWLRRRG